MFVQLFFLLLFIFNVNAEIGFKKIDEKLELPKNDKEAASKFDILQIQIGYLDQRAFWRQRNNTDSIFDFNINDIFMSAMFGIPLDVPRDALILMLTRLRLIADKIGTETKYSNFKLISMEAILNRPIDWKEYENSEKLFSLASEYAAKYGKTLDIEELKRLAELKRKNKNNASKCSVC